MAPSFLTLKQESSWALGTNSQNSISPVGETRMAATLGGVERASAKSTKGSSAAPSGVGRDHALSWCKYKASTCSHHPTT